MRHHRGLALLVLIPVLVVLADGDKKPRCEMCKGEKTVRCFALDGKGGTEVTCPACKGVGGFPCRNCNGEGKKSCQNCQGTGKAQGFTCKACGGVGHPVCPLCVGGKVPCFLCNGKKVIAEHCLTCAGKGKLPCPGCQGAVDPCPVCEGKKTEHCPACVGKGEMEVVCKTCGGTRYEPCATCGGLGYIGCSRCQGLGSAIKYSGSQQYLCGNPCEGCGGRGRTICAGCKGKGGTPCKDCGGKGYATAPCWLCGGSKTIACRHCAGGQKWSVADADTGALITVYPCETTEPQIPMGIKNLLPQSNYATFRVVVDGTNAKKAFPFGANGGYGLFVFVSEGVEQPISDIGTLGDDVRKSMEKALPIWGMPASAIRAGESVAPGKVIVRIALVDKNVAANFQTFRLRLASDPQKTIDLKASSLDIGEWQKDCTTAAMMAGK